MTDHHRAGLELTTTQEGDVTVVEMSGELDFSTAPQFRALVATMPSEPPAPDVRLDMSNVTYVDSVGIGLLVSARKRVHGSGGTLELVDASPSVRRVIEISGLTEYLGLTDG